MKETFAPIIEAVRKKAIENHVPIVRKNTLERLLNICQERNAKRVLEIGTATGYSALNMLALENDLHLTTIEKEEARYAEAKENFAMADATERVSQILGDAGEEIQNLCKEGQTFDLVFLDGPKGQYSRYLPIILDLLTDGGVLFADNILLGGLLKDDGLVTHKNRTMVRNMRDFLEKIQNHPNITSKIYEIDDGFAVCEVKKP